MPKLKEFFIGKKAKTKTLSTLSKEQKEITKLINQGLNKGKGPLADIYGAFNEQEFKEGITDPAMKNFKENILPQISEKYIAGGQSLGSGQRGGELAGATDLQSKLAELTYGAKQQQKQNRIGGVNTSLGIRPVENIHTPASEGVLQGAIKAAAHGAGQAIAG